MRRRLPQKPPQEPDEKCHERERGQAHAEASYLDRLAFEPLHFVQNLLAIARKSGLRWLLRSPIVRLRAVDHLIGNLALHPGVVQLRWRRRTPSCGGVAGQ